MRVRMAPSPTGPLHIGTARTSLYNFLAARHEGGTYVLRIEDTDVARSTAEFERDIIDSLHWLGISWDEGPQVAGGEDIGPHAPYRQSDRMELYAREADRLLESGAAYRCWCTPEELEAVRRQQEAAKEPPRYNRRCLNLTDAERAAFEAEGRPSVIRFKVEPEVVRFDDLVRGEVEFDNALLGDFVIVRNDGVPLYHFVRGRRRRGDGDHRRHPRRGPPVEHAEAHRAHPRARLPRAALRAHPADPQRRPHEDEQAQVADGHERLPRGGLPAGGARQLPRLPRLVAGHRGGDLHPRRARRAVRVGKVHKGGAIFDQDRLDHLNGVYIRALTDEQLALRLRPWVPEAVADDDLLRMVPLVKERLVKLGDVDELIGFAWEPDDVVACWYGPELLAPKKGGPDDARRALESAPRDPLAELDDADFSADVLEQRCREAAEAAGMKAGDFFSPIRVAVTGRTVSPPLFASLELLGRERSLARIDGRASTS